MHDDDPPVFAAPWQAQAFVLAVALNARGHFTWREWTQALSAELARRGGAAAGEDGYYLAWLDALERLLECGAMISAAEREERMAAWDRAARATPHGRPIVLEDAG